MLTTLDETFLTTGAKDMPRAPSRNTDASSIFSLGGGAAQTELTKPPAANARRRLTSANAVIATLCREWSNGFSIFMFSFRFSATPPLAKRQGRFALSH